MVLFQLFLAYLAAGAVAAFAFTLVGAQRLIPGAHVSLGARLLLIPGAFMLWPLVVRRWVALGVRPGRSDTPTGEPHS